MINIYSNFLSEESVKVLDDKIEEILYKSDPNVPNFTTSLTSWKNQFQNSSTSATDFVW